MSGEGGALEREITVLVRQLADFSTRGQARRRLVMIGKPAVAALVEALESPLEGVAWSAAKTLGDIGASDAVEPLTEALANPVLKEAAADALRRITGKEPPDAQSSAKAGDAARLSDAELVKSVAGPGAAVEKTAAGYAFNVALPGGRHQKVEMLLSLKDIDGSGIIAFYTECGPASPAKYEWALKTNLKIPFGAFAVRDASDGPKFVMVDAYLRESATAHQLKRAVETLAKRADALEDTLTGSDRS